MGQVTPLMGDVFPLEDSEDGRLSWTISVASSISVLPLSPKPQRRLFTRESSKAEIYYGSKHIGSTSRPTKFPVLFLQWTSGYPSPSYVIQPCGLAFIAHRITSSTVHCVSTNALLRYIRVTSMQCVPACVKMPSNLAGIDITKK